MDYLPTLINAAMVAAVGTLITFVTRTQIRDLKDDVAELKIELKQDIRDLRSDVRAEIASVRSDITQIALAVGAQPPQTG